MDAHALPLLRHGSGIVIVALHLRHSALDPMHTARRKSDRDEGTSLVPYFHRWGRNCKKWQSRKMDYKGHSIVLLSQTH